jgi:NADH:ubiquinone reductase (H+-translocating)
MAPAGPHRVVVIGSGFGGLFATERLRREPVEVTLIDREPYHLFQPLLYQVTTGILSEGEIAPPTRQVLRRQRNARVLLGEVTAIDLAARAVTSEVAGRVTVTPYDSLIVAAGASQSYFGNDHFAEHAPGMKSIDDALRLRGQIFHAFELAELAGPGPEQDAWLTFVVVGGGATGVEMAGQLAELSHHSLEGNFSTFDPRDARVILVEAGDGLLTTYGEKLSGRVRESLERLGVDVRLGAPVIAVDADGVTLRVSDETTERIAAKTKIWAAGVSASALGSMLASGGDVQLSRTGQVQVLPDCTLPGHPEVFVVGDLMSHGDLPGVAQVAIQSGQFAARQIARRVRGRGTDPEFRYHDKGQLATIARFRAVAVVGPLRVSGFPAWVLWLVVHLFYLVGFKNRLTVLLHWAVTFIGGGRSERTAPTPPLPGAESRPATGG